MQMNFTEEGKEKIGSFRLSFEIEMSSVVKKMIAATVPTVSRRREKSGVHNKNVVKVNVIF